MRASLPPDLALGYRRFRTTRYAPDAERWRRLAEEGQRPTTMVVACADSRSGPETVFDARPGELFVVRNVAALVPPYAPDARQHAVSAALEYAVLALEVRTILVLGHAGCGGIAAAIGDAVPLSATDFIGSWVAALRELAAADPGGNGDEGALDPAARARRLERRSIERSLEHLRTFPWIAEREATGRLGIVGAWFDVSRGVLHVVGPSGWTLVPER